MLRLLVFPLFLVWDSHLSPARSRGASFFVAHHLGKDGNDLLMGLFRQTLIQCLIYPLNYYDIVWFKIIVLDHCLIFDSTTTIS